MDDCLVSVQPDDSQGGFLEMMLCVLHRYSICILIVELIGITSVIPYAAINIVHTHPTGSAGLPVDDGFSTPDKR